MVNWTASQKDFVWEMLDNGKSAAEIGNMMGTTKGTVMGRIHRDARLREKMKEAFTLRATRLPGTRGVIAARVQPKLEKREPPPPPPPPRVRSWVPEESPKLSKDRTPPATDRMALVDTRDNCKWPLEDNQKVLGGIICCGAATKPGNPYCEFHKKIGGNGLFYNKRHKTKELT